MAAGVKNNSCLLVPSGILTSSSFLQGYIDACEMRLFQVTTWHFLLLQAADLTESP